jgi:hypothetical protein
MFTKLKYKFNFSIHSLLSLTTILCTLVFLENDYSQNVGEHYRLNINNIDMPLNRNGIIADVNIQPGGSGGKFDDIVFLFSAGFYLSGFSDDQLWSNGIASASLVQDYLPGIVGGGGNPQMYVLNSQDPDFGLSWQEWSDAVNLGADFYDGDGNGIYTPVDYNSNGQWDPEEDRPDLLGDETVWCVYNDGVPALQRRWNTVPPYGIEIRQTVFAFASVGAIGNLLFLRYRIKYVGLGNPSESDKMTDVYFGVWTDPDIGEVENDVAGSDVERNAGYTYDNEPDYHFGNQPPCFMVDFLSGPVAYIPGITFVDNDSSGDYTPGVDTDLDTAYSMRGQVIGILKFPGATNLPISSFVFFVGGDPNIDLPSNKEEVRNYLLGLTNLGNIPDPCVFPYGEVRGGVDCNSIDPKFWFSGDPVTDIGWIATINTDVKQTINTGPFDLNKGEVNEIVVAYVVGQGINPIDGITAAREIDDIAQNFFESNFYLSTDIYQEKSSPKVEYSLQQNYPNPFNPGTIIMYEIPGQARNDNSFVTLKVYDVLGNEIATLVNEKKPAGSYEVEFDGIGLSSGIYFYRLSVRASTGSARHYVETRKMVLIK